MHHGVRAPLTVTSSSARRGLPRVSKDREKRMPLLTMMTTAGIHIHCPECPRGVFAEVARVVQGGQTRLNKVVARFRQLFFIDLEPIVHNVTFNEQHP